MTVQVVEDTGHKRPEIHSLTIVEGAVEFQERDQAQLLEKRGGASWAIFKTTRDDVGILSVSNGTYKQSVAV